MSDYWARMPNTRGRNRGPIYTRIFDTPAGVISFELEPNWVISRRSNVGDSLVKIDGHDAVKHGYTVNGLPRDMTPGRTGLLVMPTLKFAKVTCERFVREVEEGVRDARTGRAL